ncbi:Alpha/Beta hydrolase protein [Halteromyces radiatus]|uniref:Alpha/Beta hydrolase protein n=1 Tax=Halteromyces radiatus TaxID=101107 RepID=UPI00222004C9|nr:Alpha/Beta hydrolase protein [Halteromyces radiatus]KAI8093133.1 Alpha/Beta hydrolase protein [Halteromyces radiatus]
MTSSLTFSFNPSFENYGQLDLYSSPQANTKTPLLVFIHGGAWRSEDKQDHRQLALDFVNQGFTVAVTNYRLSLRETPEQQPKVQHPNHIQDTFEALTFLYNTPPTLTYDKENVFLVGHSAGAHIATMLILDPQLYSLSFIRGIVGADGIYDLPLLLRTFPTYLDFVSQAFGPDSTTYFQASPISKTPLLSSPSSLLVPTLIIHSMDDQLVDVAQANSIFHHLQSLNMDVTLDTTSVNGDHYDMIKSQDFIITVSQYINKIIQKNAI